MSSNRRYLTHRLLRNVIALVIIVTFIFLIPRMMPETPSSASWERRSTTAPRSGPGAESQHGLDRPLHEQYFTYLRNLVQGNFGYSFHYSQPVWSVIAYKLKWTLVLLVPSTIFGAIMGVVFGSLTGWRRSSSLDAGTTSLFLFLYSMPHYWLAMLFVLIFAFYLGSFL
jgi:peptide/nickel transport system permease protein